MTPADRREQRKRWHEGKPQYITVAQRADMRAAHYAVLCAIRSGELVPWPRCAMPDCQQSRTLNAHHASYAPDMRLQVTWLCRRCHHRLHMEHRYMSPQLTNPPRGKGKATRKLLNLMDTDNSGTGRAL